jgi:hypothetical protein
MIDIANIHDQLRQNKLQDVLEQFVAGLFISAISDR